MMVYRIWRHGSHVTSCVAGEVVCMSTVVPFVAPTRCISDRIAIVVDGKVRIYCARRSLMGRIVTSTVLQQYIAGYCTSTRYGFQSVLFHRTDVYSWVRRYCNIVRVLMLQYDQYLPVRTDMHN
jgi:hypothetical protein